MRGRTLNEAFIIMDEAQNTTVEQMKMFLTRLGNQSRAVITGDLSADRSAESRSGVACYDALHVLDGVEGIRFCHFEEGDVVRHQSRATDRASLREPYKAAEQLPLAMDGVPELAIAACEEPVKRVLQPQ